MARRYKPFWDRWFELVPGHAKVAAFFKDPIDPARPGVELARALGLFVVGALMVAIALGLGQKDGTLMAIGSLLVLAGVWPLAKLAEYGAGRFIWLIAAIGTLLHFMESPTLAMFGLRLGGWVRFADYAMGIAAAASLLAGTMKLTNAAIRQRLGATRGIGLDDHPAGASKGE